MYKLVAIDLDGTLLNSNGVVTQETKETLQELINKNMWRKQYLLQHLYWQADFNHFIKIQCFIL